MERNDLLTQQKLQQILQTAYIRAEKSEKVNVIEFIEEIKRQITSDK